MNVEDGKFLANHIQWLIERENAASDSLSTRAGVLLGGIGVELAFFVNIKDSGLDVRLASSAFFVLIISAIFLLISMIPRRMHLGDPNDFAKVVDGQADATLTVVEHLVKYYDVENRPLRQYRVISRFRGRWLMGGLLCFLTGQVLIAIAFIVKGR